ncbi:MAG: nucleotidyltransferase domain-containing protein [Nitrospirae bacterium]|nr:nucleotidyltransferase domain-containing protein [Nitrospirota bacterium]
MRLDAYEKEALSFALKDFKGKVYLFGSRLDNARRGGDIDVILIPQKKVSALKLSLEIQAKFFSRCEEKIDVLVYDNKPFSREMLKNAKKLNISRT